MTRTIALVALAVIIAACGAAPSGESVEISTSSTLPPVTTTSTAAPSSATTSPETDRSTLADRTRPVGSALLQPTEAESEPVPVRLSVPSLGISRAEIIDVGVEPNGEMEIPGATEVGWYRFGAVPGSTGSAVLAAHIAFNGVDGVFRRLSDIDVGETFSIEFDDGSVREFRVTETGQYGKAQIPFDRMFTRSGAPEVALVTCGGDFNRSLNSYSDNVIAFAIPLDG